MALKNLTSFVLSGGSRDNPLVLTSEQISGLINLSLKENCTSDISGFITTTSGRILKYQKYLIEQAYPELEVLAVAESDSYSVTFPDGATSGSLSEGDAIRLIANNIAINTLQFRVTHQPVGISESIVKDRIRIVGDMIVCDAPQENLTWSDTLKIEACPIYSDFEPVDTKTLYLTVNAVKLNSIKLNYTNELGIFTTTQLFVEAVPANCTKGNGLTIEASSVNDGGYAESQPVVNGRTITYTTPGGVCTAIINVKAYMYGNKTAPVDTKDGVISVVSPGIKAIVRMDGTVVSGHPIRITDPGENVHLLENGDLLETVVGQSYIIGADDIDGYTKRLSNNTVIAINGIVKVYLDYTTKLPDVYVVYKETDENGKNYYETAQAVIDRGDENPFNGYTLEAICVKASNCTCVYNVNNPFRSTALGTSNGKNAYSNQEPNINSYSGYNRDPDTTASAIIGILTTYTWTVQGNVLKAYLSDTGEAIVFFANIKTINAVLNNIIGGKITETGNVLWIPYGAGVPNWNNTSNYLLKVDNRDCSSTTNQSNQYPVLILYLWDISLGHKLT